MKKEEETKGHDSDASGLRPGRKTDRSHCQKAPLSKGLPLSKPPPPPIVKGPLLCKGLDIVRRSMCPRVLLSKAPPAQGPHCPRVPFPSTPWSKAPIAQGSHCPRVLLSKTPFVHRSPCPRIPSLIEGSPTYSVTQPGLLALDTIRMPFFLFSFSLSLSLSNMLKTRLNTAQRWPALRSGGTLTSQNRCGKE